MKKIILILSLILSSFLVNCGGKSSDDGGDLLPLLFMGGASGGGSVTIDDDIPGNYPTYHIASQNAEMGGNLNFNLRVSEFGRGVDVDGSVYVVRNRTDEVSAEYKIGEIQIKGDDTSTQDFSLPFGCNRFLSNNFPFSSNPGSIGRIFWGYIKIVANNPADEGEAERDTSAMIRQTSSCTSPTLEVRNHPAVVSQGENTNISVRASGGDGNHQVSVYLATTSTFPSVESSRHFVGSITVSPNNMTQTYPITIPNGLVTTTDRNYYIYLAGYDNRLFRSSDRMRVSASTPVTVSLSGKIEYEHVPIDGNNELDLDSKTIKPARGVLVSITESSISSATFIHTTTTDNNGNYSFNNINVFTSNLFLKARGVLHKDESPEYNIAVRINNYNSTSPYEVVSASIATSSCTGSGCTVNMLIEDTGSTRRNSVFAILDTIKKGIDIVSTVSPNQKFPDLDIIWSTSSNTGSYFTRSSASSGGCNSSRPNCIYLLGNRNSDSDDFDSAVVAHEFTHYLEGALSRSDSIGGAHTLNDYLEPRIAYGEGLGNAMGGIINNDPIYRDSSNEGGFDFNLETGNHSVEGFYSEFSVQSVIWDLFDSVSDTKNGKTDNISLPFSSIWLAVMDLKNIDGITSFHEFIKALKVREPGNVSQINDLLGMESIAENESTEPNVSVGIDEWFVDTATMSDHTCNGATVEYPYNPIIQTITSNYSGIGLKGSQFCGFESPGMNKLFGSRFFAITPSSTGNVSINVNYSATPNVGTRIRYIDFYVYNKGNIISSEITDLVNKTRNVPMEAGKTYILETRMYSMCIQNWGVCDDTNFANDGETTYNVTVTLP